MLAETQSKNLCLTGINDRKAEGYVSTESPERMYGCPLMKLMLLLPQHRVCNVITQKHLLASGKGHRRWALCTELKLNCVPSD